MRIETKYFATPLVSGAVAVATVVAPSAVIARADSPVSCGSQGASATGCLTSGNVQLDDAPPVQDVKQYPYPDGLGIYHHAISQ